MEDKALKQRGLDDQIAIYEIKLAKMREMSQKMLAATFFSACFAPTIILLINLKNILMMRYTIMALASVPLCLLAGCVCLRLYGQKYKKVVEAYNALAEKMVTLNNGGK